jgi:tellurite methyltransferase
MRGRLVEVSIEKNEEYWNEFYRRDFVHVPSQFCVFVSTYINANSTIVELGCGNGRDSHFFSNMNFSVIGVDLSLSAIETSTENSDSNKDIKFLCGDISEESICEDISQVIGSRTASTDVCFYSRFVIHSIDEQQQTSFMLGLNNLMKRGDRIFFEFRSKEDQETEKVYGNHYRRYVDTELFIKQLVDIVGVEILYSITGRGMAMFKGEDPSVSRIIAQKY